MMIQLCVKCKNKKICMNYKEKNYCYIFSSDGHFFNFTNFERKPIRKKKRTSFKEDMNNLDLGKGLDYIFKTGKNQGQTIKWCIDNDFHWFERLIQIERLKLNKTAFNYYVGIKRAINNEKKKKYSWTYTNTYKERMYETYEEPDWFKDCFEQFFRNPNFNNRNNFFHNKVNNSKEKEYGFILKLNGQVKKSEIKSYYKKAALTWHPDKHNNSEESIIMMQKINNAWDYFKRRYQLS